MQRPANEPVIWFSCVRAWHNKSGVTVDLKDWSWYPFIEKKKKIWEIVIPEENKKSNFCWLIKVNGEAIF